MDFRVRVRLFNQLTRKHVVYMIRNMKPCNITSRSFIIARPSERNTTTAKIKSVQYLVSACIIG